MSDPALLDRLSQHRTLAGLTAKELDWLVKHGEVLTLAIGDVLTSKSSPVRGLFIVLSGHLTIYVDRGAGRQKVMEWHGGDVTGLLPYSRLVAPPSDVTAEEPTEILKIDRELVPQMPHECPELTAKLVHVMLDRARQFTSADLQNEKMWSLGKLAAGLAHELNNPASAVVRSAEGLAHKVIDVETASRVFGGATLTPAQHSAVARARSLCMASGAVTGRSALARADREERITEWLEDHGAEGLVADALVDSAITEEALDQLAAALDRELLLVALELLVAECAAHQLVSEIQTAASRIHKLVAAVKGFTYMDQANQQKPVDVGQALSDSILVLSSKARKKVVAISLEVEPGLPQILGLGGALNQVWANLIDNALDAATSEVVVAACKRGESVIVKVRDDGPGIPEEIRKRIFDPFFTTKPQGEGTGLGLDTARRLVLQHHGSIDVESKPGRTEFAVCLPIDPGKI
ncbi:MAG TPA: ATP-binding protein [Vicinamibacterales bacterium]|nr:ATP-binding protein [Vicinamibacterales bacterium]